MGDGDGWVTCELGHRHWGRHGAAGLLLVDGARTVLQHRAEWTHEGGTWGLPGGARDSHEDPVQAALREAWEEAEIAGTTVSPLGFWIDDHGGWSYTTVVAEAAGLIEPHAANAESTEIRWWTEPAILDLPLHHGLAANWSRLGRWRRRVRLVVDCTDASPPRTLKAARSLARHGVTPRQIRSSSPLSRLLPTIELRNYQDPDAAEPDLAAAHAWWKRAVETTPDPSGDLVTLAADTTELPVAQAKLPVDTVDVGVEWLFDAAPAG
ncbi:MAG: NUDIX hydrolase [Actinobacteria bacterium]|nr:NUDIX hydrolase [Actinomycetota bacterium]